MIKKIIAWLLLLVFSYGIYVLNSSDWTVLAVIGVMITLTYLIHLYAKNQKLTKYIKTVWKYTLIFTIIDVILIIFKNSFSNIFTFIVIAILIIFLALSFFLVVAKRKVDLVIIILVGVSIIGTIFKHYHLPGAPFLFFLGWTFPAVLFMFILYQKITEYDSRTNSFLNLFKNFICLTLTIGFLGITFKMTHSPVGDIFNFIALPALILAILLLVFLLPASNFIEWTNEHKRLFYRALLIPLIYLSTITSLSNVFPETFGKLILSETVIIGMQFNLEPYEIQPAEGMEDIPDSVKQANHYWPK